MKIFYNLLYKVLVKLVDHDNHKIKEESIQKWLINSYRDDGFRDWLTNKYAHYTKYLTGAYRGDEEYKKVITKLITLRQLELEAKSVYDKSEELNINTKQ